MGGQLAIVSKGLTSAERNRRYRKRITAPAIATAPGTASRFSAVVPFVLLCAALAVAGVSGTFSVVGLTAIFAGSFWSVIGMGVALEAAKLSAVAWLGRRYATSRWIKGAIVTLVVTLMSLNAIGCYGFLAKAQIDHAVAGETQVADHAARINARRQVVVENVADLDRRIAQIDSAVAEATKRGRTASAMALAERQTGRRDSLLADRARVASALASIAVESAKVENERAEQAADFGPVRYLSSLIGMDRDVVMRWFIFFLALLLDPLAVVLLLAANAPDQNVVESPTAKSQKPNRNAVPSKSSACLASNPKQNRVPFWWARFGHYVFNLSPYGSGRSVKVKNPKAPAVI